MRAVAGAIRRTRDGGGAEREGGQHRSIAEQLNEFAAKALTEDELHQRVKIDAVITLNELDADFFEQLARLEPCGTENPHARVAVEGVQLRGAPRVVGKNHLRFNVTDGDTTAQAIWWGRGLSSCPRAKSMWRSSPN